MFDLAITIAPAALIFATWKASLSALQSDRLEVVLHDHRDAVQRRPQRIRRPPIHRLGLFEGLGVGDDNGVEGGAVLVEGVDAAQVLGDELAAGNAFGQERRVDLRDGGLVHFKRRRRLR
jgi:hypothetical protein